MDNEGNENEEIRVLECAVCQQPAFHCCGKCKNVNYCSREHQTLDWQSHRQACRKERNRIAGEQPEQESSSSSIENSLAYTLIYEGDTLSMQATKELKPGDFIFSEGPGVMCPMLSLIGEDYKSMVPCYGCFLPMNIERSPVYRCSKCGLPLCSTDCEAAPIHRSNECQALRQMKVKIKKSRKVLDQQNVTQYLDICILKLLLFRKENPAIWNVFYKLQNSERFDNYTAYGSCSEEITGESGSAFRLSLQYAENDSKLVLEALHLLITFWEEAEAGETPFRGLYFLRATMKHSCVSNTFTTSADTPPYVIVKASKQIKKGEVLTWDFSGGSPWSSTSLRKNNLFLKNIICGCYRCADPTEFGSFPSAFSCSKCGIGVYLSLAPLIVALSSLHLSPITGEGEGLGTESWQCNNPACKDVIRHSVILEEEESAKRMYSWKKNNFDPDPSTLALHFIQKLENETRMAPTHYIMLDAIDDYMHHERKVLFEPGFLNQDIKQTELDPAVIERKREYSQRLLTYLDLTMPDTITFARFFPLVEFGVYSLLSQLKAWEAAGKNRTAADLQNLSAVVDLANENWRKALRMAKCFGQAHFKEIDPVPIVKSLIIRYNRLTICNPLSKTTELTIENPESASSTSE